MKFDYVIGNPPFDNGIGDNTRKQPLYHYFMDAAQDVANKVELITPARFLFNAGQTPKKWNQKMLNDEHFKILFYEPEASNIFPGPDIKGGIAISYWDAKTNFGSIKTFTPYNELNGILQKVTNNTEEFMETIVSARGHYRLAPIAFKEFPELSEKLGKGTGNMLASNSFEKIPEIIKDEKSNSEYLKILGRKNNKRVFKFIDKKYLLNNKFSQKYNVVVTEANGKGSFGETLSSPMVIEPGTVTTDTFISIGQFDDQKSAENSLSYIKTKFCRALLSVKKSTQHTARNVWSLVPIQDFTDNSDIDWSKSIPEIDQQLYKKYGLSDEEINFIEEKVQAME